MKKIIYLFFGLFLFFSFNEVVYANYSVIITGDAVSVRKGPGTNYTKITEVLYDEVYLLATPSKIATESSCNAGWYQIYYASGKTGYVCSTYANIYFKELASDAVPSNACETDLKTKGFPSSYWQPLCFLKELYPNWVFEPDLNGIDFAKAVAEESVSGMSRIETSYDGYKSTASGDYDYATDTFYVKEGTDWFNASSGVVAYYLDPRNWLSESQIFQFENLGFNASNQNENTVKSILANRDLVTYSKNIFEAGQTYLINANFIASKIRQETGANFSNYSLGCNYTIVLDGKTYCIYNPYNIGAGGGAKNGLIWASKSGSYLRPWTSIETAIAGGASFLAESYINKNQNTIYFQKFNVASDTKYNLFAHQYMQNIRGASSEGNILYGGYNTSGLITSNSTYVFRIPIYQNMPTSITKLPSTGNPNNHLSKITINGNAVEGFSHDGYNYTIYIPNYSIISIGTSTINSKAKVSGDGEVTLNSVENNIVLAVTAENGNVQNYNLKIIKTGGEDLLVSEIVNQIGIKTSGEMMMGITLGTNLATIQTMVQKVSSTANVKITNSAGVSKTDKLATGDKVTIINGGDAKTYTVSLLGDLSGDGEINIADLLKIKKAILGYLNLDNEYLKAADINSDNKIDIADLLKIKKHILGYLTIS